MRKLLALAFMLTGTLFFTSCSDDDDNDSSKTTAELQEEALSKVQVAVDEVATPEEATGVTDATIFNGWTLASVKGQLGVGSDNTPATIAANSEIEVDVTANITANTTWDADSVYILRTRITVVEGVTLTIEPGTIIKGDASKSAAEAAVLMIARGGKIMAEGTEDMPIIMTSTEDNIQPGFLAGNTLDSEKTQKWGGLVILGKAPVSAKTENPQIEGVDATDANGQYGGDEADDNSGVLKYVSLRHGGVELAGGNEINGLSLGGVGSGTVIENIEIYANYDDGIEFFGGTVNVKNVLVYTVGDDGLDVDQSYAGTIDNFIVYVSEASDKGLEIDGREGAYDDTFVIKNGSIRSIGDKATTADFKEKAKGSVTNVMFENGNVKLAASFDTDTYVETEDAAMNVVDGSLTFTAVSTADFEVYTKSFDGE